MNCKVLIVDDNPIDLAVTENLIRHAKHEVTAVTSAHEALDIINSDSPPDIILLDWMMPEIDGLQLCVEIRKIALPVSPYIIMVTSNDWSGAEVNALDLGADDFIEKPVSAEKFLARLSVASRFIASQKKLLELAHKDELTGLLNRRAGIQAITNQLSRLKRSGLNEHCLIIADIDHFKQINDQYGHMFGDEVLKGVAAKLLQSVRPFESVTRFGGEEFLIFCEANKHNIDTILARLTHNVSSQSYATNGSRVQVTMSFGCLIVTKPAAEIGVEKLIHAADSLLYLAKDSGRNRYAKAEFLSSDMTLDPDSLFISEPASISHSATLNVI
jgi:diguanylate cyclase (GGDEF)-like protein